MLRSWPGRARPMDADFAHAFPRVEGADAGRLGEAISFHNGNIKDFLKPLMVSSVSGAAPQMPNFSELRSIFLAAGICQQDLIDGRNRRPEIDLVFVHHFPEFAGAEGFAQHDLSGRSAG